MKLNLKKDCEKISRFIKQRIKDYPNYINEGPGKDEDPITQVTLGFDFIQAGWIAIVFDTRREAEIDGEWQSFIELNELEMTDWNDAFESLCNGEKITITSINGRSQSMTSSDEDAYASVLGEFLKEVLERNWSLLEEKLPLSEKNVICIEHHNGYFGWSSTGEGEDVEERIIREFESTPENKKESFINKLVDEILKQDEKNEMEIFFRISALKDILESKSISDLYLLQTLAGITNYLEWSDDYPSKKISQLPFQKLAISILNHVTDSGDLNKTNEGIVKKIFLKSIEANLGRKLWGLLPRMIANILHDLNSDLYPKPKIMSQNQVKNYELYT